MIVTDYNEQFLDKIGTDHLIDELKAYINGRVDLSDYVTKSELQAKLDALHINIDLSSYATKEELTQAINSIDLSAYAKKTDIPSLDAYAKKTDLPKKVSELENDSGYLTQHQDLSAYALKTEIPTVPSLNGYATTEYVDNAIANVPSGGNVDLSNYYTKNEVYSKSETNALIPTVTNGKDGVSPTVTVTKEGKVATITCNDVNGTTTATISDGKDGSGGGGASGITYAYDTEIATGETYFDGRPIYMRIFHIDPLSSAPSDYIVYGNYKNQTPFANTLISAEPIWQSNSNQKRFNGNVIQSFTPASGSSGSAAISAVNGLLKTVAWVQAWQSSSGFAITVTRGQDMYDYGCDVFVKYVKSA